MTSSFGPLILSCIALALAYYAPQHAMIVRDAWTPAQEASAAANPAFLSIESQSETTDYLVGGYTPVAERVELHNRVERNGRKRTVRVTRIPIDANDGLTLKPNGYHIMLVNMSDKAKAGSTFPLTLKFQNSGSKQIVVSIDRRAKPDPEVVQFRIGRLSHGLSELAFGS